MQLFNVNKRCQHCCCLWAQRTLCFKYKLELFRQNRTFFAPLQLQIDIILYLNFISNLFMLGCLMQFYTAITSVPSCGLHKACNDF